VKPRIGVTVSRRSGWRVFPFMALAVWLAGGRALRWQAGHRAVDLDDVDGVVIGGGDDITPTLYGGELSVGVRLDPSRKFNTVLPRKRVDVTRGTLLARTTRAICLNVNALHSQAVDDLGRGLRIAARDEGGMVQAVERMSDPFAVGVQWHPEYLVYRRAHRRLFRALVAAARARQSRASQMDAAEAMAAEPRG